MTTSENPNPPTTERLTLKFTGTGMEMALLMLKNLFLTIITLGIYRPWATTNMRRYVWGHMTFLGDRASYTGTGKELFLGWIKLFGIFFVMYIAVIILSKLFPFAGILVLPVYFYIFALATYSGLRYRMSRTLWRQIRFGVEKNRELSKQYLKMFFIGALLSMITLGIYTPWFLTNKRKFLTDRSRFGSVHFSYDGVGGEYAGIYFLGLLLSIITLGIYTPWWTRGLLEYRWTHTMFQGKRFGFSLTGGQIFLYFIAAFFITLLTFGLATPWIFAWGLHLMADNTYLEGMPDFAAVQAMPAEGSAMADDLLSGYDLDIGL